LFAAFLVGQAWAASVDFTCDGDQVGGLGVVGLPPMTVTCSVVAPTTGTWDAVSWTFGDGTVQYGDSASFTYDDVGQYTISVQLDGFVDALGNDVTDPKQVKQGFVTLCGPPEPDFTWRNKGGLRFALTNETVIAPFCLDDSSWSIYEGRSVQGEPAMTFTTWEPRFELPSDGAWTIVLDQQGLGGEAASVQTLEAKYQLTDDLKDLKSPACSTGPASSAGAAVGLLLALVRRRS
jgi:hypothetical protein